VTILQLLSDVKSLYGYILAYQAIIVKSSYTIRQENATASDKAAEQFVLLVHPPTGAQNVFVAFVM